MDRASLYADQGHNPRAKPINKKNTYYDDGTSITMQLQELVSGVEDYATFFDAGRHEHFMMQIEGEDFAVVVPFNNAADEHAVFEVIGAKPQKTSRMIFAEACKRGSIVLSHKGKPFGLMTSYVDFAPE